MAKYGTREDKLQDYDPKVDYMEKMQQAAAAGDYEAAAEYEQMRNEKIKGEGLDYAPTYDYSQYLPKSTAEQIEEIFRKLQAREPFHYDLNGDELYRQYAKAYEKQGRLAMEDSVGLAAELTGGYGNSYAQTVGQQSYQAYLDRLNAIVPELYDRAKEDYEAEGEGLYRQYGLLAEKNESEKAEALARQKRADEKAEAQAKAQQQARDRAYALALKLLQSGVMPSEEVLKQSGLSDQDAQGLYAANTTKSTSGGSGGGGSGSKTEKETEETGKKMSNSLWTQLNQAYLAGRKKGDWTTFYQLKSMLAAQGYDTQSFDDWGQKTYGEDYAPGFGPQIDWESVLALGYGSISEQRLQELVEAGQVISYTRGGRIYYQKVPNPGTPSFP